MRKVVAMVGAWTLLLWAGAALAQQPGLTGSWQLEISSPQGKRTRTMVLTQDGTQVAGTYRSDRGEVPVTGTIDGDSFTLTVKVHGQDQQELVMEYRGRVQGDALQGRLMMGRRGEVDFTGRRAGT